MMDARAVARVIANRVAMRNGRTTKVAMLQRSQYGGYVATSIAVILKQRGSSNPAVEDLAGTFTGEYLAEMDMAIDAPSIAYLALTGGATDDASIAAAQWLEVVQYRISGLVGNRWQVSLRRLR